MILAGPIGSAAAEDLQQLREKLEVRGKRQEKQIEQAVHAAEEKFRADRDLQRRQIDDILVRQEHINELNTTIEVYRRRLANAGLPLLKYRMPGE